VSDKIYTFEDIWYMLKQFAMKDEYKSIFKKMHELEIRFIWSK